MAIIAWSFTRNLTHPILGRAKIVVCWLKGRWVPMAVTYSNGRQEDGLEALTRHDLVIANPYHPVPQVVLKGEV